MLAFFLAPIYLLVNFYVLRWLLRWMKACYGGPISFFLRFAAGSFYSFLALSPLSAFLITGNPWHRFFQEVSNYWLGTFAYILMAILLLDVLHLVLKRVPWVKRQKRHYRKIFLAAGGICVAFVVFISMYGIFHAKDLQVKEHTITVYKPWKEEEMTVILLSDLHFGYNTDYTMIEKMVERINRENADFICIAGDIFDNEYEAIEDPDRLSSCLSQLKSRFGVYACYGNHDVSEKILAGFTFRRGEPIGQDERFIQFLEKSDIEILEDETVEVDGSFYVVGRKDPSKSKKEGDNRKSPWELFDGLDANKPVFVLDHQPKQLKELMEAGADVDLSGHTHDGQLFPGNLLIQPLWENACGILKIGNMTSCVTSGVGVWGPAMRVGTDSEIMVLHVKFCQ